MLLQRVEKLKMPEIRFRKAILSSFLSVFKFRLNHCHTTLMRALNEADTGKLLKMTGDYLAWSTRR